MLEGFYGCKVLYEISENKLPLYKLEREEQIKPKASRKKEIIMVRAEINKIEYNGKQYRKLLKTKFGYLKI